MSDNLLRNLAASVSAWMADWSKRWSAAETSLKDSQTHVASVWTDLQGRMAALEAKVSAIPRDNRQEQHLASPEMMERLNHQALEHEIMRENHAVICADYAEIKQSLERLLPCLKN